MEQLLRVIKHEVRHSQPSKWNPSGIEIIGEVRNDSVITVKQIKIVVPAYDDDGKLIAVGWTTILSSALPGESAAFCVDYWQYGDVGSICDYEFHLYDPKLYARGVLDKLIEQGKIPFEKRQACLEYIESSTIKPLWFLGKLLRKLFGKREWHRRHKFYETLRDAGFYRLRETGRKKASPYYFWRKGLTGGKRLRVKKSRCRVCGARESLIVHHIVPLANGGEHTEDNVAVLCRECHNELHREERRLLNRRPRLSPEEWRRFWHGAVSPPGPREAVKH